MGYTITIGELAVEKNPGDGLDCSCISFDAAGVKHEGAPAFGDPTDFTNSRWPGYSVWSDFMRGAGLYDVFFDDRGHLIGGHPGVRLVTQEMVDRTALALAGFKAKNPGLVPAYGDEIKGGTLCRLIWLDYWLRWSLENCTTPVIANS
jgi:hypothetical protein